MATQRKTVVHNLFSIEVELSLDWRTSSGTNTLSLPRSSTEMGDSESPSQVYYTCRKCSSHLFDRSQVLHEGTNGHSEDGMGVSAVKASWSRKEASYQLGVGGKCSSVFTHEAPDWASETDGNDGRITCPKCKARVGSYTWSGAPCSCGKWVTPAFQFQLSRIDPKGLVRLPTFPMCSEAVPTGNVHVAEAPNT